MINVTFFSFGTTPLLFLGMLEYIQFPKRDDKGIKAPAVLYNTGKNNYSIQLRSLLYSCFFSRSLLMRSSLYLE